MNKSHDIYRQQKWHFEVACDNRFLIQQVQVRKQICKNVLIMHFISCVHILSSPWDHVQKSIQRIFDLLYLMRRTLGLALSIFIPTLMTRPEKTSPSTMVLSPASEPPPGNRLIFTNFRMSIDFLLASSGGLPKIGSLYHNLP